MNKFIGMGRITKAAETRTVNIGNVPTLVTDFTVALNNGHQKPKNNEQYGEAIDQEFVRCSVWRDKGAKIAPYLTKGRNVMVTGALRGRAWVGNDGKARYDLTMSNPQIELIGNNPATGEIDTLPVTEAAAEAPTEIVDPETGEIVQVGPEGPLPFAED